MTTPKTDRGRGRPAKLGGDVKQVAIKMGSQLRERISAAAEVMRAGVMRTGAPGEVISDSDVCRYLIELGLGEFDKRHVK